MGCCGPTRSLQEPLSKENNQIRKQLSEENQQIMSYERNLNLSETSLYIYEAAIRNLLTAHSSKKDAFERIFRSYGIQFPNELRETIEAHLINESNLNVLFLFFVLISKGTDSEKRNCIWYLYDRYISNVISLDVLKTMFRDIITAASSFSVDALIELETTKDRRNALVHWKIQSVKKKETLVNRLCAHFVCDERLVTKEEFELKSMEEHIGEIHSLVSLRTLIERTPVIPIV